MDKQQKREGKTTTKIGWNFQMWHIKEYSSATL
jgi:hypothetical protein